jgi:hypothetical protein
LPTLSQCRADAGKNKTIITLIALVILRFRQSGRRESISARLDINAPAPALNRLVECSVCRGRLMFAATFCREQATELVAPATVAKAVH